MNINRIPREIVCVQCGQSGIQLGNAVWELLTLEHHVLSNGKIDSSFMETDHGYRTFFDSSSDGQIHPRLLTFDTEPTVIDEIRSGIYRKLFNPEMLINGFEDSANNFARGYLKESCRLIPQLIDKIRQLVEKCDNLQGFILYCSTAGGTSGGLLSALLEYLVIEYSGRCLVQLSILPGNKLSSCIVQPYNCILSMERLIYNTDISITVDNEMLHEICSNQLDIERPSFSNINRVIAPIISGLTSPIRYNGFNNNDLRDLSTNLIPYPRLHFPFASYSPLVSNEKFEHDILNTENITRSIFNNENQFVKVDLKKGRFMSSVVVYRGNCDLSNTLQTIQSIKAEKDLYWVDWCPTGFKISHTMQTPFSIPGHGPHFHDKSAMMLSNNSSIVTTFIELQKQFKILFNKGAYIHWYVLEGLEEFEMRNALYEIEAITNDYLDIVKPVEENEEMCSMNTKKLSESFHALDYFNEQTEVETKNHYGNYKVISPDYSNKDENESTSTFYNNKINSIISNEPNDALSDHDSNTPNNPIPLGSYKNVSSYQDEESMAFKYRLKTSDSKEMFRSSKDELKFSIRKSQGSASESLKKILPKLSDQDMSNLSNVNAHNSIFSMCENKHKNQKNKNNLTKKSHYIQKTIDIKKSDFNIFNRLIQINKDIFQKLIHSQEYDLCKMQSS